MAAISSKPKPGTAYGAVVNQCLVIVRDKIQFGQILVFMKLFAFFRYRSSNALRAVPGEYGPPGKGNVLVANSGNHAAMGV